MSPYWSILRPCYWIWSAFNSNLIIFIFCLSNSKIMSNQNYSIRIFLSILAVCWAFSIFIAFWFLKRLMFRSISREDLPSLRNEISWSWRTKFLNFIVVDSNNFRRWVVCDWIIFFTFINLNIIYDVFLNIYLRLIIIGISIYYHIVVEIILILNLFINIIIWILNAFLSKSIGFLNLYQSFIWFWIIFFYFTCISMIYQLYSSFY